jgi:UDP-3-O-[3-hydroxymyristoyl] glucosamine N-acyltransferase
VAAQSGVMHDIPEGEKWFGYPAQPDRKTKRQILALHQLPELLRRVAELERRLHIAHPPEPPPAREAGPT